jgi:UDPglucose 6-dehydrogenase
MNPDRIVIGVESDRARDLLLRIYEPLMDGCAPRRAVQSGGPTSDRPQSTSGHQLVVTNLNTAELIKHASNAFLAMKVSFINMVADLCEAADADVDQVAKGLGMDPRIGDRFLQAGIGFGGYCLPKDLRAFRRIGEEHGVDMTLVKATSDINETRAERLVSKVRKALWVLEGKRLAVWGLAFKPGTDDVREAPSEAVVRGLLAEGAILQLHDPQAMHTFRQLFVEEVAALVYCDSAMEAVSGADALLVLTEWPEYLDVDLAQVREEMAVPVIIDGRNHLDPVRVRRLGFEYHGMGR